MVLIAVAIAMSNGNDKVVQGRSGAPKILPVGRLDILNDIRVACRRLCHESFDALTAKEREDRVLSLMNRLDPLLLDSPIRNIIAQKKSFRLTDTSILIVSLPKRQNYDLLAALAMSRWRGRTYVERPHLHVGASVPIVACRYLSEMQDQFRERMLGNATIIAFRTGGREP
ncbi:hypothetical protein FJ936_09220 [Mesorhizobium sp. B2-4-13]|uniref:hypothetical protein n=1 Tax=Mesorhizobium sp. B2-4-13 TaxID=2589936 RepID=UPI001153D0B2|nr:hypothetical protein [Mesorhizobium sp. B2-4-13]TPK85708.1 hypothetical protein FJ936_09220 [Mesorhizobium sp. B2-4-13]